MSRHIPNDQNDVVMALRAAASAQTLTQLRQCLAILLPALTGASLAVTAAILGVSRHRLRLLRRQFRAGDEEAVEASGKRGGRRRALMSLEEEIGFLRPWLESAGAGARPAVAEMITACEQAVGRRVSRSTIYRMLARQGWRKDDSAAPPLVPPDRL